MTVALYVVVARLYPAMLHPRVFAWFAAAWIIPSLVGPAGAGAVAQHAGWRWVFLGVALLVVPTTLVLVPALRRIGPPETAGEAAPRGRLAWAALAAAAVLGLNLAAQVPLPWSVRRGRRHRRGRPRRAPRRGPRGHDACGARPAERHRDPRPGLGGVPGRRGVPAVPAHRAVRVLADHRRDRPDVRRCRLGGDVVAAGAARGPAAAAHGRRRRLRAGRRRGRRRARHRGRPPAARGRDRVLDPRRRRDGPRLLPADRPRARLLRPGTQGVNSSALSIADSIGAALALALTGLAFAARRPQPGRAVHRRAGGRRRLRRRRRAGRAPRGRGRRQAEDTADDAASSALRS